jgi:hypothetical protein
LFPHPARLLLFSRPGEETNEVGKSLDVIGKAIYHLAGNANGFIRHAVEVQGQGQVIVRRWKIAQQTDRIPVEINAPGILGVR